MCYTYSTFRPYTADYSVVLFTIEELIAAGAVEIAVDLGASNVANLRAHAPAALGARIIPVPISSVVIGRVVGAILTPVFREFRIDTDGFRHFRVDTPSASIGGHVAVVASNLYQFLVAMRNRLQVDLDLPSFLSATVAVRAASKDPEGRANLAVIEGLLKSYRPLSLDCVDLRATATPRAAELFAQFVEDHGYQSISMRASAFGYPERVSQSEKEFSHLAREFVESATFKQDVCLGNLSLAAATPPSTDNPEITNEILSTAYLPPIVSFAAARERATKNYETLNPSPIWPVRGSQ